MTHRSEPQISLREPRETPNIVETARSFTGATDVDRMAIVMMLAWGYAEPKTNIAEHPASYVATFADMAREVIANHAYILGDGERTPVERFADMAAAQFDSELDYTGTEIKRRIEITAHIVSPDHPATVAECPVCADDDALDALGETS